MAKLKIGRKTEYFIRGMNLLDAREELGLTQRELADKLGWSQQNISLIEGQLLPHAIGKDVIEQFKKVGLSIEFCD